MGLCLVLLSSALAATAPPAQAQLASWAPPETFDSQRFPRLPASQPEAGRPYIFGILGDQLFGSNRENDHDDGVTPIGADVKHSEAIQVFLVNIGKTNWSGRARIEIVEERRYVDRNITDLAPFEVTAVSRFGYLELEGSAVTVRGTAWEGDRLVDSYERVGNYQRDWPQEFPLGIFIRDLVRMPEIPAWMPGTPFAASFLNTRVLGNSEIQVCDNAACEETSSMFYCCWFRWLNLGDSVEGNACLRARIEVLGPSVSHAAGLDSDWPEEHCFTERRSTPVSNDAGPASAAPPPSRTPGVAFASSLGVLALVMLAVGRRRF